MSPTAAVIYWIGSTLAVLPAEEPIRVSNPDELRRALADLEPGRTLAIAPGTYPGGFSSSRLQGTAEKPIVIGAADPKNPPTFSGGTGAFQFSKPAHLVLHDLVIEGATGNGLNIDDGGDPSTPARHVKLQRIQVRDVGPTGNRDGIKLSGVQDFQVKDCLIERWGSHGSGIDMVGCRRGEIVSCVFRHGDEVGDSGVQAKGGSEDLAIRRCRFENAGARAVNLGGSTGLAYFRPKPNGFEARNLTVEDCLFLGSSSPIAFVGVDGAIVRHNTIHRPKRWAFRILQETRSPGFVPCRNGRFTDNLIVFRSDEMVGVVNVGDATSPESFVLARNAWYCLDAPARGLPRSSIPEEGGRQGVEPHFRAPEIGDFQLIPESHRELQGVGAREPVPARPDLRKGDGGNS